MTMKRIYVIMEDANNYDPYGGGKDPAEPVDFCETLEEAEDLCLKYEEKEPGFMYYYRAVIKGE